jgi:hypothetical protein
MDWELTNLMEGTARCAVFRKLLGQRGVPA